MTNQKQVAIEVEAKVHKVISEEAVQYFVAFPISDHSHGVSTSTSITCSLVNWHGNSLPIKNQMVLLGEVQKFSNGWRARTARPIQLSN